MAQFGDFTVDRNSTKYVLGSGGTIISYATDEPAFEFNADGSYKGLLVEPAATNLLTYSEDFTQWDNTRSFDDSASAVAPDGTETATSFYMDNTAASSHIIKKSATIVASSTNTFSVFLKPNALSFARLVLSDTTVSDYFEAYFDLSTGQIETTGGGGLGTFTTATMQDTGNGWYRCAITGIVSSDTSVEARIYLAEADNDFTIDGDGTSGIYVWGAQLETGPIATSYIPTASAAVTRVKDDITQTGASSLIGQTEGTLYVEVDWRLATGQTRYLLNVNDGTVNNRLLIYNTAGTELRMFAQANGGSIEVNQGVSSSGFSGIQKIAFAYKTNDFELYRNGSSVDDTTSGSLAALATLTNIDLGQRFNASDQANMHIRAVALYPKRLGAVELEVLTGAPTYGSYALMASSLGYTVE
jgi:hypothetical protein